MLSGTKFGVLSGDNVRNTKLFQYILFTMRHGVKHAAVIETLIFLCTTVLISDFAGDGDRFINMSPHPFWIIVLLITLQYGANEAIMAAILSSFFLLVLNLPEQSLTETMYGYMLRVLSQPFLWIITALVLGGIRTRQLNERDNISEKLKKSRRSIEAITEGYNAVKQSKEQLEMRLASEKCSILTVYEVAKSMETTNPAEVPAAIARLVNLALNPIKFSIYRYKNNVFKLDAAYGWRKSDTYSRQFPANTPLAQAMLNRDSGPLSIINHADEKLLMGQGIMAGVIIDKRSGKIFGMLKIEEMKFGDLGSRTRETFLLVCEWIAYVFTNVEKCNLVLAENEAQTNNKIDFKNPAKLSEVELVQYKTVGGRRNLYAKK